VRGSVEAELLLIAPVVVQGGGGHQLLEGVLPIRDRGVGQGGGGHQVVDGLGVIRDGGVGVAGVFVDLVAELECCGLDPRD